VEAGPGIEPGSKTLLGLPRKHSATRPTQAYTAGSLPDTLRRHKRSNTVKFTREESTNRIGKQPSPRCPWIMSDLFARLSETSSALTVILRINATVYCEGFVVGGNNAVDHSLDSKQFRDSSAQLLRGVGDLFELSIMSAIAADKAATLLGLTSSAAEARKSRGCRRHLSQCIFPAAAASGSTCGKEFGSRGHDDDPSKVRKRSGGPWNYGTEPL
jgi:hypothetical protein